MLDAYGLPVPNRRRDEQRLETARLSYEAACERRGIACQWDELDADQRWLWLMTADALMEHEMALATPATPCLQ